MSDLFDDAFLKGDTLEEDALACGPSGSAPRSRLSRRGDPETSAEAAARVEPELGKSQKWLLAYLELYRNAPRGHKFADGFTDKDVVYFIQSGINVGSVPAKGLRTASGIRTRRLELARAGLLELVAEDGTGVAYREDGKYAERLLKRQHCMVWRLT